MNKTIDIEALVRPSIRELSPYRSARDDFERGILLDANENAYGSPIRPELDLHRYPMPTQDPLRSKIAAFRNVAIENIFLGVGSDEPIDLLIRIFCEPGRDAILVTPPTYGMYRVSAAINDVRIKKVQLTENFQPRTETILEEADSGTRILFLCSPNNPTANDFNREEMLKLVDRFPGIVVVDEAYIDFSNQESLAAEVTQYPNLVVLQTLSKSFGLAGIRLGIAISSPEIIRYLLKIKPPYNVNKLTASAASEALDHLDRVKENIISVQKERDLMMAGLQNLEAVQKVFPSNANFILFRIEDAENIYRRLAKKGIIARYRGNEPGCEECIRVTVGLPDENTLFLQTLKEITS